MTIVELPSKSKFLRNFSRCENWEEKYLYLIELGSRLPPLPDDKRIPDYLIAGCQSQVWIVMVTDNEGKIQLYGDSDSALVRGLVAAIFILYKDMTLLEIITYDMQSDFDRLSLTQHLTISRSHGLETIIKHIRSQAADQILNQRAMSHAQ